MPLTRSPAFADLSPISESTSGDIIEPEKGSVIVNLEAKKGVNNHHLNLKHKSLALEAMLVSNMRAPNRKYDMEAAILQASKKQCPVPGYDIEAAIRRESSPTPTLVELDEDEILLDLEQRGIRVCDYAFSKPKADRATK
ncbi:hypothetical protein BT96DRAFT_946309 [Gymnopus androsaceus JB14]|uniref:Uncharacterized protein n=1 Tax=Gymnopus androsaceus JB14 TaxID=1447944 RepID=A0A6A4GY05_9AGAR|nr:hypothetical protein BT96DRAFT_946309 [Gymnopus androsaceus JB14]